MPITYGSVCSGIEAATQAWHPLGMRAAWFAEIEPFPSAVLAHHYPNVPNHGDMTKLAAAASVAHTAPTHWLISALTSLNAQRLAPAASSIRMK